MRNAQEAGYDGVIVYNKGSNELEQMSANDDSDIFIPSVFVGKFIESRQMFAYFS